MHTDQISKKPQPFWQPKERRQPAAVLSPAHDATRQGIAAQPAGILSVFIRVYPWLMSLLFCSCSMVSGKRRSDGSLVVTSWRLLWKSEAIAFAVADTNFNVSLSIGKSRSDEESIKLAAEAAARAAVKAALPIP